MIWTIMEICGTKWNILEQSVSEAGALDLHGFTIRIKHGHFRRTQWIFSS